MKVVSALLTGAGIGVLGMYVLDPEMGRRRRALARDKVIHLQRKAKNAAAVTARDLRNRTFGTIAEGKSRLFQGRERGDDTAIAMRVRSKLGFLVRHPSSIQVQVSDGRVSLSGPVLADEVQQLVGAVESVKGVRGVENRLDVHESAEGVPGLQGEPEKRTGRRLDLFQQRWSPATRFLLGTAGVLLALSLGRKVLATLAGLAAIGAIAYNLAEEDFAEQSQPGQDASPYETSDPEAGWSE